MAVLRTLPVVFAWVRSTQCGLSMAVELGSLLGGYEIISLLGVGGMVKVLDFGLANALETGTTDASEFWREQGSVGSRP